MPSHDTQREPAERISRRSLLQGAAAAGAAGLAVTTLGGALSPAAASTRPGGGHVTESTGPIVAHVRNAKSGDIEVFSGTSQTRLRDTDLAARIARAIG
jgi:nitrous oxide reductase